MPPLREIRQDIPGLADYLLFNYCREMKMEPVTLTPEAQVPTWIILRRETSENWKMK